MHSDRPPSAQRYEGDDTIHEVLTRLVGHVRGERLLRVVLQGQHHVKVMEAVPLTVVPECWSKSELSQAVDER
jgi:hypothetical protein